MNKKARKPLLLFLSVLFMLGSFHLNEIHVQAATTLKYHFIDTTGSGGGDATLIDNNGNYYLIDGGTKAGVPNLKAYLKKHCKKNAAGKIPIYAAIITHYHTDHFEGIVGLLNDTAFEIRQVFRPDLPAKEYQSYIDTACKKAKSIRRVKPYEEINIETRSGNTGIIYGPAGASYNDFPGTSDTTKVNNSSMIFQFITSSGNNVLLLGDLYYSGFKHVYNTYRDRGLFKNHPKDKLYKYCKVGHHGVRNGGSDGKGEKQRKSLKDEIIYYQTYVDASVYIFTASKETIANPVYGPNFIYFTENIGGTVVKTRDGSKCYTINVN